METTGKQGHEVPLREGQVTDESDRRATATNGATSDHGAKSEGEPGRYQGRRVTPSTAKCDETPEERAERKRHLRTVLDSLRAKTPEEAAEQRETLRMLEAALSQGRPDYEKLFPDTDE